MDPHRYASRHADHLGRADGLRGLSHAAGSGRVGRGLGVGSLITIRHVADIDYYRLADHEVPGLHTYLSEGDVIANSAWLGTAAERYGLSGPVSAGQFDRIAHGLHPVTGTPLFGNGRRQIAALDVTASVGKDVSVMWALDPAARPVIEAAVRDAAASVIRAFELDTAVVRRGHNGARVERADGLTVASFFHHTSRAGDPQLHVHMVVANMGTGSDGRTTALHLRRFYNDKSYAEAIFQSALRHNLATTLGYTFESPDRFNYGPIAGVPVEVQRTFSKRYEQIRSALEHAGMSLGGAAARTMAVTTRPAKDLTTPLEELTTRWRSEAAELGWTPRRVETLVRTPSTVIDYDTVGRVATERTATYRRQGAVSAVARTLRSGASLDQLIGRTDEYLSSNTAVVRAEKRWTTAEILALETEAINAAERSLGRHQPLLAPSATQRLLESHPELGVDQREFVASILESSDGVQVAVAPPGTGKTFATAIVVEAAQREGRRVLAVAPSARAAAEIRTATGLAATTTATLIGQLDRGEIRFGPRDLLIADEFGMQATREAARIITATQNSGARLLVVGDPKQLPEIEAGGLLGALTKRLPVITLSINRRQHDLEEQQALHELREGQVDAALDRYQRNGNLTLADDPATLRHRLVHDWFHAATPAPAPASGIDAVTTASLGLPEQVRAQTIPANPSNLSVHPARAGLMVAATRHGVRDLNTQARMLLAEHGLLGRHLATIGDLELAVGDRVVALQNRYDLGVLNGDFATVTDANPSSVRIRLDNGTIRHLPAVYVVEGHLDHGYATTVHKAQGATCERLFFLGDEALYAELGYTALSRGRHHNHLYALNADLEPTRDNDLADDRLTLTDDPLDNIRRGLRTSRAQTAAIDLDPSLTADTERAEAEERRQRLERTHDDELDPIKKRNQHLEPAMEPEP